MPVERTEGAGYNTETRCGYNTKTRCGYNTKFSKNFMREWLLLDQVLETDSKRNFAKGHFRGFDFYNTKFSKLEREWLS